MKYVASNVDSAEEEASVLVVWLGFYSLMLVVLSLYSTRFRPQI